MVPDLPGKPTNLERVDTLFITEERVKVELKWGPPANIDDALLLDYRITNTKDDGTEIVVAENVKSLSHVEVALVPGLRYNFRV